MSQFPKITRAIPRQRYQVEDYAVSVLGEIESPDPQAYHLIMAFVPDGKTEPVLYICSEKAPPNKRHDGTHQIRVINHAMSEVMDQADQWKDLDTFAAEALKMGCQLLSLAPEKAVKLM